MIPARAKVNGLYVNNAMAKTEAQLNGFDEAIMLNVDGHVSEGSGENIVMIRHGVLITPPQSDNILEGITLETALYIADREFGLRVERRSIDRSELYIADEIFMTGTAAHVTPVTEVDRVAIGDGRPGVVSQQIQDSYFKAITGRLPQYLDWLTPVYEDAKVADRKSVVSGKSVSVRVDLGGRRIIKKKNESVNRELHNPTPETQH